MAAWREYLANVGYEKLSEAEKYEDILSKDDPEDEPFKSMYKARDIYKEVKKALKKFTDKRHTDEDLEITLCLLELRQGVNFVSTEEKATGEEHLESCLEKLEPYKLTAKGMGIYQDALNQMGILWTGRNKAEEALEYFKRAEELYVKFKNEIGGSPWRAEDFLHPPEDDDEKADFKRTAGLESTYTHTLFYYAQVYQQLGDKDMSAQYCHETLQRQLDSTDLNPLEWSLHAATLSQYYMTERDFEMSRHCLASAEVIFQQAEANLDQSSEETKEKIDQARADIQRCWIKYSLGLLEYSREMLYQEEGEQSSEAISPDKTDQEDPSETDSQAKADSLHDKEESSVSGQSSRSDEQHNQDIDQESQVEETPNDQPNDADEANASKPKTPVIRKRPRELKFNLEVTSHEEKITCHPVKTFDDAREIFLKIKKWIEDTKTFYKFDLHCNDYVAIVQDHSLSFKFLSFFEPDLERQCKMHKRRIDMLGEILKELNPQYYLLVSRQLMFEIADTYSSMLDLKMAILQASGGGTRPTPHNIKKINALTKESIKYYQEYLNTLKGGKPVYPDEFPENDVRPGLVAFFCMGRLHSKFVSSDLQTRLLNIKKSKECYQFVVDYCKCHPSAVSLVATELELCQEMVQLLPAKMEKMRRDAEQ